MFAGFDGKLKRFVRGESACGASLIPLNSRVKQCAEATVEPQIERKLRSDRLRAGARACVQAQRLTKPASGPAASWAR